MLTYLKEKEKETCNNQLSWPKTVISTYILAGIEGFFALLYNGLTLTETVFKFYCMILIMYKCMIWIFYDTVWHWYNMTLILYDNLWHWYCMSFNYLYYSLIPEWNIWHYKRLYQQNVAYENRARHTELINSSSNVTIVIYDIQKH